MRRALALAVLAALAVVSGATAALGQADPYEPQAGELSVSTATPDPGQAIIVAGKCPTAGLDLTISILPNAQVIGQVTTGPDGAFSTTVTIPSDRRGTNTLVTRDVAGTCVRSATIEVSAAEASSPGGLAFTGSDSTQTKVSIGAVLVAIGVALCVIAARRRRARDRV